MQGETPNNTWLCCLCTGHEEQRCEIEIMPSSESDTNPQGSSWAQ